MRMGNSIKILIPVAIIILVLFIIGFIIGPIGSQLFNIKPPEFLSVSKPHVILPSEPIPGLNITSAFTITNTLIASWFTIIVLVCLFYFSTRKMKLIPGRLQSFAELIVESLLNFIKGSAGEKNARILFPVVATIFLYVITNAYLALLPFFGTVGFHESVHGEELFIPLFRSANTDVNVPLSIAIVAFVFIEFWGIRAIGLGHYIGGFFNFGQLRDGVSNLFKGKIKPAISGIVLGLINIFVGVLEVFSHFIRIISFTFRLFGNMTAGEILLVVVCFLIPFVASTIFISLELLIGFIQALIFAGLTLVFGTIALTPHSEE
jgi:F-type H+-transporting ATPase subunit a